MDWAALDAKGFAAQLQAPSPYQLRCTESFEYLEECVDPKTLPEAVAGFDLLHELGSGSYSTVQAAREKKSGRLGACWHAF